MIHPAGPSALAQQFDSPVKRLAIFADDLKGFVPFIVSGKASLPKIAQSAVMHAGGQQEALTLFADVFAAAQTEGKITDQQRTAAVVRFVAALP